jgi:hypothetical protein
MCVRVRVCVEGISTYYIVSYCPVYYMHPTRDEDQPCMLPDPYMTAALTAGHFTIHALIHAYTDKHL